MMAWLDDYSSFLSFIITLILVIITGYYASQIRKQANYAHITLEAENKRIKNVALNYSYLIYAEMILHQNILVNYIYERIKFEGTAVVFYNLNNFQDLEFKTWNMIKTEIPQYYSSKLMQELVEYYSGIELIATNKQLNDQQKLELVKYQFSSMYKCINLIEAEFKIELRKRVIFKYDECVIKMNTKNGEIAVDKEN